MSESIDDHWWVGFARMLELPAGVRACPVAGGDIAACWCLQAGEQHWFVKLMPAGEVLAAEADGLRALAASGTVRVPAVRGNGSWRGLDWLLLDWLDLAPPDKGVWRHLGERLALMHHSTGPAFGWERDNFIGRTPQPNGFMADWPGFFRERRLGYQLALARENGLESAVIRALQALMEQLPELLPTDAVPSLLHGDLWSGNLAASGGESVIFDPAVYYGHSEADLAMMELFAAPPADFWSAYRSHRPVPPEYPLRRELYNLYHLLNHYNLFGGGYGAQAGRVARRLLAETRA